MSAHTQASVLAEFEEVALEPNESFPHGIRKFNRYACAQACADARNERDLAAAQMGELAKRAADDVQTLRNALVLDEAKVEAACDAHLIARIDDEMKPVSAMRAALLAAGFTERAT